jgi:hypothetical protein
MRMPGQSPRRQVPSSQRPVDGKMIGSFCKRLTLLQCSALCYPPHGQSLESRSRPWLYILMLVVRAISRSSGAILQIVRGPSALAPSAALQALVSRTDGRAEQEFPAKARMNPTKG